MRGKSILIAVLALIIVGIAGEVATAEDLTEAGRNIMVKDLIDLGFKKVGGWHLADGKLLYDLSQFKDKDSKNVLYAFIVKDTVKYIGKSAKTMKNRMDGYKNPGPTQKTNIRNRNYIIKELEGGNPVDIWIFFPKEALEYKGWDINVSAGLEEEMINRLSPEWNLLGR